MKADLFIKAIGKTHTVDVQSVSDRVDALPAAEKAKVCALTDAFLEALAKRVKSEHHLLVVESLVVTVKYSQTTIEKELKEAAGR